MTVKDEYGYEGYRGNTLLKKTNTPITWTPELIEELEKCRNDPLYFIKTYIKIIHVDHGLIPFDMYDFQEDLIKSIHENRYIAACWARQIGKTTTIGSYLLWHVIFNERKTVAILANKADTAQEILFRIQDSYVNLPKWLQQGTKDWNKRSILFENGSRIFAAATTIDNIRGVSTSIIYIDEAAYIDNFDEFYQAVFPTISSGSTTKVIQSSTPRGLNSFYKTVQLAKNKVIDPPNWNGYELSLIPWNRVPGRDESWKEAAIKGLNGDVVRFQTEFELEFLGSSGTLIAGWKLRELVSKKPIRETDFFKQYEKPILGHSYAIVADVSRGKGLDYSAFSVIDITSLPYKQVGVYRSNMVLPRDYTSVIHSIGKSYFDAMVLIEINDIGEQVSQMLYYDYEYENVVQTQASGAQGKKVSQGFGKAKADIGIRTTKTVKNKGCQFLKILVEQNQLLINDYDTIFELSTFSKKNQSYEAEQGKNDDIVMGLVLFAWLTTQDYFKQITDIDTLERLRERSENDIFEDMLPFGYIDIGLPADTEDIDFDGQMVRPEKWE